jgi:ribosomal protein S18 acetylase RimI-like enzyme
MSAIAKTEEVPVPQATAATVAVNEGKARYDRSKKPFTVIISMEINKVSTKEQLSTVENLAYEIWYEHYTPIIGKPQVEYMLEKFQSLEAMREQIRNGSSYFLILDNDIPVGYMGVELLSEILFLSKFYVIAPARRKGYGKMMITYLEALAKEKDLNTIALTVNKNNTQSIKMYEKVGFVISGSVVKDIGGGFFMDDYQMEKRL